jgi:hypothetical protein
MVNVGNWLIQLCFNNNILHRSGSLRASEQHGRSSKRKLLRKVVIVLLERKILVDAIFMEVDFAGGLGNGPTRPIPLSNCWRSVSLNTSSGISTLTLSVHLDVAADFVQPTQLGPGCRVFGLTATFGMTFDGGWLTRMRVSSVAHSSSVGHQQPQLTFHGSGVGKDGFGMSGLKNATRMVLRLALYHGHAMGGNTALV